MGIQRYRRLTASAAISLVVATLGGCSGRVEPTPTGGLPLEVIDQVDQPGISDFQRSVLETARTTGVIAFNDYYVAISDYRSCVAEAGVETSEITTQGTSTHPTVDFSMTPPQSMTEEALLALDTRCYFSYASAVQPLYDYGAADVELVDAELNAMFRIPVSACLKAGGIDFDEASETGWRVAAGDVPFAEDSAGTREKTVACIEDTGFVAATSG
jgi:hypothetical protein